MSDVDFYERKKEGQSVTVKVIGYLFRSNLVIIVIELNAGNRPIVHNANKL